MTENEITEIIIGCAIREHKAIGPGLLELAYEECMDYELRRTLLNIERQKPLPLIYEDVKLNCGYRLDFMVNKKVILEIKTVDTFAEVHTAQVLTYLKLSGCKVGLLLNFHTAHLKNGIKRLIL